MANHKSAAKRARQSVQKKTFRSRTKGSVRSAEKKLRQAIAGKDQTLAQTLLTQFSSKIDKAASKGVYHYRTAARRISRAAQQVHKLGA